MEFGCADISFFIVSIIFKNNVLKFQVSPRVLKNSLQKGEDGKLHTKTAPFLLFSEFRNGKRIKEKREHLGQDLKQNMLVTCQYYKSKNVQTNRFIFPFCTSRFADLSINFVFVSLKTRSVREHSISQQLHGLQGLKSNSKRVITFQGCSLMMTTGFPKMFV